MVDAGVLTGGIIVAVVGLVYVSKAEALARWQKKHFGNSWLWATKSLSEGEIRFWYRVGGIVFLGVAAWALGHAFK